MTTKQKTRKAPAAKAATPSGTADDLMGFFRGRDPLEIERIKATLESAFPRQLKAEEMERDTALDEAEDAQERLTVIQLAADLADGMKHLAKAFAAERQLRIAEGR